MTRDGYEYDERHVAFDGASVVHATDAALLVSFAGDTELGLKPVWIPLSQVHEDSELYEQGTDGTLIVSRYFAEQAELV